MTMLIDASRETIDVEEPFGNLEAVFACWISIL